jgi:phospholipid transport system transporter-binding protein
MNETSVAPFRLTAAPSGQLAAQGPLTFATAREALELGVAALRTTGAGAREIDCAGISASDSAGLAVLIEWLGTARRRGQTLRFARLPQGLAALARISEVDELLTKGV